MEQLRGRIRAFLGLNAPAVERQLLVHEEVREAEYTRKAVSYVSGAERVQAFLFEPHGARRRGGVVALHQHNSQWRFGKSEIAGLVGDPHQAFGPALARAGVCVLAPDAWGFESRQLPVPAPTPPELAAPLNPERGSSVAEWAQYYNLATHRLARGEVLMRELLLDVDTALEVLRDVTGAPELGLVGHSYGGNLAIFGAALNESVAFAVSSGAVCSYRYKFAHGVPLELGLVIPGFATQFDFDDLLCCVAPRRLLVVSSDNDPLSGDAGALVAQARPAFEALGAAGHLEQLHTPGPHRLDTKRFRAIVDWVTART